MSTPSKSQRAYLLDIDVGKSPSDFSSIDSEIAQKYQRGLALVRLHTHPLGMVELNLAEDNLTGANQIKQIWAALHDEISAHLLQDGWTIDEIDALKGQPIPHKSSPRCLQAEKNLVENPHFVSIIIATRDRPNKLASCLQAITQLEYPKFEIIIVDNAPKSSATHDLSRELQTQFPHIRYVLEPRPGLANARNCGLQMARGTYIAFVDDDVTVDPLWLSRLVLGFGISENVACVTGMVIPAKLDTDTHVWFEWFGRFNKGFKRRVFDLGQNRIEHPLFPFAAGTFGTGANMAFKRSFLLDCGGFDPALGIGSASRGGEDLAMFYQVIRSGNQLIYEPGALVYHSHRQDYQQFRKQVFDYGVGLTAYLTKILIEQPSLIFTFLRKSPSGLFHIFSSQSSKNEHKPINFPRELTSLERMGMLLGPFAYLRSRWDVAKSKKDGEHVSQ